MQNTKNSGYDELLEKILNILPKGKDIYDLLMGTIEQDLLSDNILSLSDKYKNETQSDRMARIERYKNALKKYDAESKKYFKNINNEVEKYRGIVEGKSKSSDEGEMENLEKIISNT